jgi:hypothetical protein
MLPPVSVSLDVVPDVNVYAKAPELFVVAASPFKVTARSLSAWPPLVAVTVPATV